MKQPRNIGLCIVLSLITCGIYMYYWIYCVHTDMQEVSPEPNSTSGGMVVLLSIVTCGIYYIYWNYKMGLAVDAAKGTAGGNTSIVYLLLSIFGLGIVSLAMMQNELNNFVPTNGGNF